jgi:hypothetical protein
LFTIVQANCRIFFKKNQNFPILKREHRKIHLLSKFKPSRIFSKISKVILNFLTLEFALENSIFQDPEYEVHKFRPIDEE